jgi:hypothetical protein
MLLPRTTFQCDQPNQLTLSSAINQNWAFNNTKCTHPEHSTVRLPSPSPTAQEPCHPAQTGKLHGSTRAKPCAGLCPHKQQAIVPSSLRHNYAVAISLFCSCAIFAAASCAHACGHEGRVKNQASQGNAYDTCFETTLVGARGGTCLGNAGLKTGQINRFLIQVKLIQGPRASMHFRLQQIFNSAVCTHVHTHINKRIVQDCVHTRLLSRMNTYASFLNEPAPFGN